MYLSSDAVAFEGRLLAPQFAVVSAAAADNTLVAAVAGKRIRVLSAFLVASGGANSARFESGTGGTALTGVLDIIDNGPLPYDWTPFGHFETAAGALLNLELSAATAVGGSLVYVLV